MRWYEGITLRGEKAVAKLPGFAAGSVAYVRACENTAKCTSNENYVKVYVVDARVSYYYKKEEAAELVKLSDVADNQAMCDRLWRSGFEWMK